MAMVVIVKQVNWTFDLHLEDQQLTEMCRNFSTLLSLILLVTGIATAQILPKENSKLNYRLIGFSFPAKPNAALYKIEIAAGNYSREDSFTKRIIVSYESGRNKIIGEVPAFGSQYTWRIVYSVKRKMGKSPLYHFTTGSSAHIDTSKLRLRLIQPAQVYKDAYVTVDAGGVLYDMKGRPVWYLPDTDGISGYVADMQLSPQGTITFIYKDAYEMNYNGDILWKAPNTGIVSGDTALKESYHHEFTRLSNGHYMILGMQIVMCKLVPKDGGYTVVPGNRSDRDGYYFGRFGTIIEYDERGNVVWSWKAAKPLMESDFDYYESRIDSLKRFDPHDNAFFFDEKNKVIYLGFRNLNRIMKIEYPSGKVLNVYGEIFKPGVPSVGAGLFCNQHNIGRSKDGYLYFFNNNSCRFTDSLPSVVMVREPVSRGDTFKKVWEYTCTVEEGAPKKFGNGGNVSELPDGSLFVNMGSEYSKLFIVNRDKHILWSALPERFIETDGKWTSIKEYRATIITRKDMERLIWGAESPGALPKQ
jgi:hypothetical protein